MIQRYTTPYHDFILPFTVDKVSKLYVTYSQNGENAIEKAYDASNSDADPSISLKSGLAFNENGSMGDEYSEAVERVIEELSHCSILTIHLTQDDTAQLQVYPAEERNIAQIQISVLTLGGNRFSSLPVRDRVYRTFKEEVI
jgi:hypothetical protein